MGPIKYVSLTMANITNIKSEKEHPLLFMLIMLC